ncbi:hypothetical protein ACX93W_06650 [Paenibacillus sp. CAU 1782]
MNQLESPSKYAGSGGMSRRTIGQRIVHYWPHYLIIVPAILFLLLFKGVPVITGMIVAFKDYQFFKGMWKSDWAGLSNFAELFQHTNFGTVISNTVTLKLSILAFSGVVAFLAALAVSGIASARVRNWISAIMVLPYFIPSTILAFLGLHQLQSLLGHPLGAGVENENAFYPALLWLGTMLLYTVKYGGITFVVALAAITVKQNALQKAMRLNGTDGGYWKSTVEPAARVVAAAILVQLSFVLSTDRELLDMFLEPIVIGGKETVDYFIFRQGFMMGNFGLVSAAWVIQFFVNVLFMILAYLLVRTLFKGDLFPQEDSRNTSTYGGSKVAGYTIALIGSGVALFLLFKLYVYPHLGSSPYPAKVTDALTLFTMLQYGLGYLAVTLFSIIATALLAYPLTVRGLPGGMVYRISILLALCATSTISVHEYLIYQNMGLINTIFPVLLAGFQPFFFVFVLKAIFNSRYSHLRDQAELEGKGELAIFISLFIPKMWKPLLAIGVLQFAAMWGSAIPSRIYISDMSKQSPMMMIWNLSLQGAPLTEQNLPFILLLAGIVALPPILLFILFRKWLVSEVLVGGLVKR